MTKRFKGQLFSYDAVVAGLLFILLLTLLYTYWNSLRSTISVRIDDATRIAMDTSNLLLTPGFPLNWNASDVNQIGLTREYGSMIIEKYKFDNLSTVPYDEIRQKLALGPYNVYIEIDGYEIKIGLPPAEAFSKVTMKRPVIFNERLTNISITVWSAFS